MLIYVFLCFKLDLRNYKMTTIELRVTFPAELLDLSQEIREVNEEHLGTLSKSNRGQLGARKWESVKCIVAGREYEIDLKQFDDLAYTGSFTQTYPVSEYEIYLIRSNLFELKLPPYLSETFKPIMEKTVGVVHEHLFKQVAAAVQVGDEGFYIGGTYVTQINIDVKYDKSKFYARTLDGFYAESNVTATAVQSTSDMLCNLLRWRTVRHQNQFRQYREPLRDTDKVKTD